MHFGTQQKRKKNFKNIFPQQRGNEKSGRLKNRKIFFGPPLFSSAAGFFINLNETSQKVRATFNKGGIK